MMTDSQICVFKKIVELVALSLRYFVAPLPRCSVTLLFHSQKSKSRLVFLWIVKRLAIIDAIERAIS